MNSFIMFEDFVASPFHHPLAIFRPSAMGCNATKYDSRYSSRYGDASDDARWWICPAWLCHGPMIWQLQKTYPQLTFYWDIEGTWWQSARTKWATAKNLRQWETETWGKQWDLPTGSPFEAHVKNLSTVHHFPFGEPQKFKRPAESGMYNHKRWDLPKFVDVLLVNLQFPRLLPHDAFVWRNMITNPWVIRGPPFLEKSLGSVPSWQGDTVPLSPMSMNRSESPHYYPE